LLVYAYQKEIRSEQEAFGCLRIGLFNFGAWRFEVFDQAEEGWKIILHPAPGTTLSPQILITDQDNGLPQLLDRARAWVLANDEPAALKACG
jgi:hypothetical protein